MDFRDFVAIQVEHRALDSIAFKATKSYLNSIGDNNILDIGESLRYWLVSMFVQGLSQTTRKRYFEKLKALYSQHRIEIDSDESNPFEQVRALLYLTIESDLVVCQNQCERLSEIFADVMQDAKNRPAISVFLYLLFNASSDIENAIKLQVDDYLPDFQQLDDIIDSTAFHHRRKYVFPLEQSRKRLPQLEREISMEIANYLTSKGLKFKRSFSLSIIPALWISKALKTGFGLSEIRAIAEHIPSEYNYLNEIRPANLTPGRIQAIKNAVANAFAPEGSRWYAIKIRRSSSFDTISESIKTNMPGCFEESTFYYPTRVVIKRVGKRTVKNTVPYLPDIVFLRTKHKHIEAVDHLIKSDKVGWVFRQTLAPGSDYSIIDRKSMMVFQRAIGDFTSDIKMELTTEKPVDIGRTVRIIGGVMMGYTGQIYDIKGDSATNSRLIYIRLSEEYGIKVELKIEEYLVEAV